MNLLKFEVCAMRYLVPVCLLLVLSFSGFAATKTWTGTGSDANWQTAANWMNNSVPVANDDLVFPAAAAQQSNNNNFFLFTTFRSITVEGGSYTFGGNPIRLTNGGSHGDASHTVDQQSTVDH